MLSINCGLHLRLSGNFAATTIQLNIKPYENKIKKNANNYVTNVIC